MGGETSPGEYFVCGGFGGICTVLVGHPLDTVKVRLQTTHQPKLGELPHYSGTFDCIKKIFANEGVRGFYKGMGAPLVGVAPIFAISFMTYGMAKNFLSSRDSSRHTYMQYFMAGAFSGIFTTLVMAPGERIKCLLQIQQGKSKMYNGPTDVVQKLYKHGGIMSIFRGSGATLLRDVPSSGFYFLTYEAIKDYITENGTHEPSVFGTVFAGGCAGVANWLVGIPPDVLKSRLQCAPEGRYPNGLRDVFRELIRTEGVRALYKGITPVLLRAFPANAACFLGFELCKKFLNFLKSDTKADSYENT